MNLVDRINFKSGKISFNHFAIESDLDYAQQTYELSQDLVFVEYPKNFALDLGWLPDFNPSGRFIILIIKDDDWDNPILRKETRSLELLELYLRECVDVITDLIDSKLTIDHLRQKHLTYTGYENFSFKRTEFQDFFEEEQVYDLQSGSFYYSTTLEGGFELAINILAVENFIALTLTHNVDHVFSIGCEGITKISLTEINDQYFLDLYKEDNELKPFSSFLIKPRVSLDIIVK